MRGHDVVLDALLTGSPEAFVAEARNVAGYVRNKAAVDAAEARARKAAAEPLTVLPFSLHRLYADTGDRNTYEALYFDRRKALADLEISILANRDGDGALSTALNDLLWAICDEYTWALPAHLGLLQRPEQITLDLFACETGLYIAEALHLLYDRIDARLAERCRAELRRRILDSFLAEYPAEWWESGTNNWGAVCVGSIGVAFLYEEKDPDRLAAALRRVLATMDAYLSSFPPALPTSFPTAHAFWPAPSGSLCARPRSPSPPSSATTTPPTTTTTLAPSCSLTATTKALWTSAAANIRASTSRRSAMRYSATARRDIASRSSAAISSATAVGSAPATSSSKSAMAGSSFPATSPAPTALTRSSRSDVPSRS